MTQSEVMRNSLIKAIRKLNSETDGNEFSLDPASYQLDEINETLQKQYKCTFVEKDTNRKVIIEIKVPL